MTKEDLYKTTGFVKLVLHLAAFANLNDLYKGFNMYTVKDESKIADAMLRQIIICGLQSTKVHLSVFHIFCTTTELLGFT